MSRYKSHHVLCKKTLTSPSLATRFHKNVPVISNDGPAPSSGIVPHYGQLRPHQYQTCRRCVTVFDDNSPAPSITLALFIIYKLSESSIRHNYRLKECIISVKECAMAMSVSSSKSNFIQHLKLTPLRMGSCLYLKLGQHCQTSFTCLINASPTPFLECGNDRFCSVNYFLISKDLSNCN